MKGLDAAGNVFMQVPKYNRRWGGKPPAGRWSGWLSVAWVWMLMHLAGVQAQSPNAGNEAVPALGVGSTNQASLSSYRIRSGDLLELKVYQEDDLNAKVRVEADGAVVLPLLGRVMVRGQTVEEAQRLIHDRLESEFLNNPQLALSVTEFAPQRYSVMGQVSRPGVFVIPPGERVTLLQGIAMAGGYTKIASPSNVKVKRRSLSGVEVLSVNAKTMTSDPTKTFFLEPDDEILVGESAL